MKRLETALVGAIGLLILALASPAQAAEGASGTYLLGSKTTMAGYLPGPGIYATDPNYFYSGKANFEIDVSGITLSGDIDANAYLSMPTLLWVTDADVLGGNLAFLLTAPVGGKSLNADFILKGPGGGVLQANASKDNFAFGDPVLGTTLGWHSGNLHYTFGALVNVPIGQYETGNPVNMGFNRWSVDATGALTWLDPSTGLELSSAAGFTFNFENPDTHYQSGTEFHAEAAIMMHPSEQLAFGINGYGYQQVTGDSGSGATLGDFKGRVFAVGPALDYTFIVGQIPIITGLRYFYEFGAENRMEGHAGFLNITVPLSVAAQ